jgi:hypothetical protein
MAGVTRDLLAALLGPGFMITALNTNAVLALRPALYTDSARI